jgi:hypothetical protein
MGASYANAPDGAATGASSFYTLVVLTLYLAAVVPILFTRLAKGNKNVTTVALAISCAGSFVAFKRVHPAAVAWADASSVFDPYDILQIPSTANATVVKKAYRSLSRTAHPDKGGDAELFRKIQNAHAALAGDATARRNYRDFGHPDGPRPSFAGFALPHGFEATAVGLYVLMLVLVLLPVLRLATGSSTTPTALPKKATVLALRDALQENAPAHISTWLLLLGKLLDEVEGVDSSEVSDAERAAVAHVAEDLDTDAGFAVVQTLEGLTPTGALLIQRAAGGRRLDEDSDTRTLDLAASLARAAFELSCGAWQPLANLQTAFGALQCLCAPKKRGSASVISIELAVYDDDEALPDVRSSDLATVDVKFSLPTTLAREWYAILSHDGASVAACLAVPIDDEATDDFRSELRTQLHVPRKVGRHQLTAQLRAMDARGVDSDVRRHTYKVLPQEDEE